LPEVQRVTPPVAFRQAILTEVLNPKTALFFLSFLPQFANPARGAVWAQLLALGAIFVAMSIAYTALLALGAASVAGWLGRHSAVGRWKGRLVGSIYVGLGVQLDLQERR
jgi:threonine/homoserine/homoserine lactone efflux protein